MSAKGRRYRITLACSSHKDLPRIRTIIRDTDRDAIDSGERELRRYRRTDPANLIYDRWTVWKLNRAGGPGSKIGEGTIDGQESTVDRVRENLRTARGSRNPAGGGPFKPES